MAKPKDDQQLPRSRENIEVVKRDLTPKEAKMIKDFLIKRKNGKDTPHINTK